MTVTTPEGANDGTVASIIMKVLAEHIEGRWSDGTSACRGCADRFLEENERAEGMSAEEIREARSAYMKLSHPRWSLNQWHEHVTENIMNALRQESI